MAILLTPLSPILANTEIITDQEVTNPINLTVMEPSETLTVLETGEAIAGAEINTTINLNEATNLPNPTAEPIDTTDGVSEVVVDVSLDKATEETSNENLPSDEIIELSHTLSPDIQNPQTITDPTIISTTTNTAIVSNIIEVIAETGDNEASGTSSVILTGDAIAYANIVNVVNTNIFNSTGLIGFFNEVLGVNPLDLREAFNVFTDTQTSESTVACAPSICSGEGKTTYINTTNEASITNEIIVRAQTGANEIGSGMIDTGDAYAVANLLNIANTNITDSNYLLLAFNNFGDYVFSFVQYFNALR